MPLTVKQRKQIWIGAGLVAAFYFGPSLITTVRQAFTPRPAVIARPSPARIAVPAPAPPDPAALQAAATAAQFGKLMGNWSGAATLPEYGMCRMALQLRAIPDKPGGYAGYSTTTCNPMLVLASKHVPKQEMDIELTKSMSPASAIMSGSLVNGAIVFRIDKAIGTLPGTCTWSGLSVSPFADQIVVQWQAGNPCPQGQLVLNRISNLR